MAIVHANSKLGRGWLLTKSSWRTLLLDKELVVLSFLNAILSIGVIMLILAVTGQLLLVDDGSYSVSSVGLAAIVYGFFAFMTIVATFTTAGIVAGATQRFRGEDPTLKSCFRAVSQKFTPLLLFGVFMSSVGLLFQFLEDRLPFAGSVAAWLADISWSIANFFSIPVIVLSDKKVMPLAAAKQSVEIIKKVWGESVVSQGTVGLVGAFVILVFMIVSGLLLAGINLVLPGLVVQIGFSVVGMGVIALILLFSTLSGIVKAALYHYATTGESPTTFNKNLLKASMTPKKAKKIFA